MIGESLEGSAKTQSQSQDCGLARYTWVITSIDSVSQGTSKEIAIVGPRGSTQHAPLARVICEGRWFRLVDTNGIAQYGGFILGDYLGDEPLRDYGSDNGCADIEYED